MNQHYNPLGFLYYPLVLCVLFTGIYFIWEKNPSLMDQLSLIEKQGRKEKRDSFLVQTSPLSTEDLTRFDPSAFAKLQPGQARFYSGDLRVNHRFRSYDEFLSPETEEDMESWSWDEYGLLFKNPRKLQFLDHSGKERWSFEISDSEFCPGPVALSKDFVYACTKSGDVIALYRDSGRVAWLLRSQYTLWRSPVLTKNELLIFDEGKEYHHIISIKRDTGEEGWKMRTLAKSMGLEFAFSDDFESLVFASNENWIYAYNIKKQSKLWEHELTNSAGAPPVVYGNRVYLSSTNGTLYSYNLKSGELDWEYDIGKPLDTGITILPQLSIGTIVDTSGYLHVMDLKAGKRKWRYNMKSNSKERALHAVRFTSDSATRLNMSAESKGWSFWGACGDNQVCAFEPFKGYMLRRFELPGPMAAAPILIDKGQELILSYLESKSLKFMKFIEKTKLDLMAQAAEPVAEPVFDANPAPAPEADAAVDNAEPEN